MADHTSILVFGRDPSLLETRTWVLQGAGFEVSSTTDVEEAIRAVTSKEVGLTILCHSLTPEQRAPVFEAARSSKRTPKVLALTGGVDGVPEGEGIVLLSPFEGPRALIGTVQRSSHRHSVGSRLAWCCACFHGSTTSVQIKNRRGDWKRSPASY